MDERELDARVDKVWEDMHPRMKERIRDRRMKEAIREFMDKMVIDGRAQYDPDTDRYMMMDEEFPPPDLRDFLQEKIQGGS